LEVTAIVDVYDSLMMPLSPDQITTHFSHLSSTDASTRSKFFSDHVSPNVNWTVMGHTAMSRTYTSLQSFLDATISVLGSHVLSEPLKLRVKNVVAMPEGGETQAVVELEAIDAKCRNGMVYDMRYCWVVRYGEDEKIREARAYIDTALLDRALEGNKP
jgi:uncharacterized protein